MRFSKLILYYLSLLNLLIVAWHALAPAHLHWLQKPQIDGATVLLLVLVIGTIVIFCIDDNNERKRY